uniref:Heterogeneous nuclear ribonucleoprotein q isoform x3 n=1 Tax=Triatoma infestans TaxID=30076 RepID=A0A170ZXM5_TRIIF
MRFMEKLIGLRKLKITHLSIFDERDHAVNAMDGLNGKDMGGSCIEVSLAKPPSDKKKKEEILRARERRMMQMMQLRGGGFSPQHPSMMGSGPCGPRGGPLSRGSSSTMRSMGRGDYDYDYDYYGYGDYRGGYSDPYYDDYYRYEDYYYDYAPPLPPARGRARQPQPGIMEGVMERGPVSTGLNSGTQGGRGRGVVVRGRAGRAPGGGGGSVGRRGGPGTPEWRGRRRRPEASTKPSVAPTAPSRPPAKPVALSAPNKVYQVSVNWMGATRTRGKLSVAIRAAGETNLLHSSL